MTIGTAHKLLILLALILALFLSRGWWKLSRALDPARADALVVRYTAPNGYINAFFQDYLFSEGWISPWTFLMALSALELVAGLALILGLLVRPFAILLLVTGLVMASGHGVGLAAGAALAVVLAYCLNAINVDKTLWDNFNAVKREIAFIAAAAVLLRLSGGPAFRVGKLFEAPRDVLFGPSQTASRPEAIRALKSTQQPVPGCVPGAGK